MRLHKLSLLASMLATMVAGVPPAAAPDSPFPVGQPFPALVLPTLEEGHSLAVSDLRGEKLVLHIFASWCAGCRVHVPVWHAATREARAKGEIVMAGIVQEQHADRARLFAQWHEIEWPIMVDAFDELDVTLVPITLLIDEYGIVRRVVPRGARAKDEVLAFLAQRFEPPPDETAPDARTESAWLTADPDVPGGRPAALIQHYGEQVKRDPGDGSAHFGLGVAHRQRYDSQAREPGDFQHAADHWNRALAVDPNNIVWRRRLEQYGPRTVKPFPFYDWLDLARRAAKQRGQTPVELAVEPGPAEVAQPTTRFDVATATSPEPDPAGGIERDAGRLIEIDSSIVGVGKRKGGTVRVYLDFRPAPSRRAQWNNESKGLQIWLDPPRGWGVEQRQIELPNPSAALSREARSIEFEVRHAGEPTGPAKLSAYALYYVCEGAGGACLYRRQDLALTLPELP